MFWLPFIFGDEKMNKLSWVKKIIGDQNFFYNEIVTWLKWAEIEAINVIKLIPKFWNVDKVQVF